MRLWPLLLVLLWCAGASALELSAVTDWVRRLELGTVLPTAVVTEVRVRQGQQVSEGDTLVVLDDRLQKARVAEAAAVLEEARHDRDEGQRELERALDLYERTVLSQHELQVAQIAAARGEAAYQRASAALTEARLALEYTRLKAPFDALVLDVAARPGLRMVNGLRTQPLVTLAESGRIRVRGAATAEQLREMSVGDAAQVLADGSPMDARVVSLGLEPTDALAEGETRYAVEAELELSGQRPWPAGLPVILRIGD
jgi:RND family efflux transporter MFP subunit